jgi:putative oxidoreductase
MALFSQLGNYRNFGLLVMRAGLGVMMFLHGLPKLTGGPEKWTSLGQAMGHLHIHFMPVMWGFMSAITESIGGIFLVLGLWFRLVCVLMVVNFVVAVLTLFASGKGVVESSEAIELLFVFFGLVFLGAGTLSVDKS